jgi:hypothetical protein
MSTCPELDLLSVYLDEELPRQYEQKLEAHLASCEVCNKHYKTLQNIHESLQEDAGKILFSEEDLEDSFSRLKTKMKYKSVTKSTSFNFGQVAKWVAPIVAAAAVFIAVLLPGRFGTKMQNQTLLPHITKTATPVKMIQETGIAREASLSQTPYVSSSQNFTTATIDIFRPELSETIRISINLSGFYDLNSQTTREDVILPTSFPVDVKQ